MMAEDEKKEEETGEKEHQAGSSWEWPQLNDTWTGDLRDPRLSPFVSGILVLRI